MRQVHKSVTTRRQGSLGTISEAVATWHDAHGPPMVKLWWYTNRPTYSPTIQTDHWIKTILVCLGFVYLFLLLFLFSALETESRALCWLGKYSPIDIYLYPWLYFSFSFWSYVSFLRGTVSCFCHRPFNTLVELTEILPAKLVKSPLKLQFHLYMSLNLISLLTYWCLFIFLSLQSSSTNAPSFFIDVKYWFWVNKYIGLADSSSLWGELLLSHK